MRALCFSETRMTPIHKQRFAELTEQMERLLSSKTPMYDSLIEKTKIEIEGNGLLEWKVKAKNLLSKACGQESEHYTEFVEKTPKDTLVLKLACGKYRFNHLDIGKIGPFPRILDMGQCNDAYSAIQVAVAMAKAFNCTVNDLPLTLVLSWYEQKAVCILLTLLALGIKNIRLGPSLPAFVSPTVLHVLVEQFGLTPTTTADADLAAILGKK